MKRIIQRATVIFKMIVKPNALPALKGRSAATREMILHEIKHAFTTGEITRINSIMIMIHDEMVHDDLLIVIQAISDRLTLIEHYIGFAWPRTMDEGQFAFFLDTTCGNAMDINALQFHLIKNYLLYDAEVLQKFQQRIADRRNVLLEGKTTKI